MEMLRRKIAQSVDEHGRATNSPEERILYGKKPSNLAFTSTSLLTGHKHTMLAKLRTAVRKKVVGLNRDYLCLIYGMNIHPTARISFGARLDKTNPRGVHIGARTAVTNGAVVLSHDGVRKMHRRTVIGDDCFIGINSVILPGVVIGDQVIVAAGAVVSENVPSNCAVAGNPAKVIKRGIELSEGRMANREWTKES